MHSTEHMEHEVYSGHANLEESRHSLLSNEGRMRQEDEKSMVHMARLVSFRARLFTT